MGTSDSGHRPDCGSPPSGDQARERRLELLARRLPRRIQGAVRWVRQPGMRWVRLPGGVLLVLGSLLSILPVLGLWMLPLGLVLLAEDVPPLRRATGRLLAWIEHHRPHWMGLPQADHRRRAACTEE